MSLADLIPAEKSGLDRARLFNVMWLGPIAFIGSAMALVMMQRLGLPMSVTLGLSSVWFVAAVIGLSLIGRTMTGDSFFYGGHIASSGVIGLGGTFDWISGSFLILFFSSTLLGQMILAPSLMLGLLLQACLFAMAFRRSGAVTVPGFFSWRSGTQLAGPSVMLVVGIILAMIALAEFIIAQRIFAEITRLSTQSTTWIVLILAILPSMIGGALGLVMVNGVLAGCFLAATLMPALVIGFLPKLLQQRADIIQQDVVLQPLSSTSSDILSLGSDVSSVTLLMTVFVLSTGFAVLPHALSRLSYHARPILAIEGVGWSALCNFLIIGALPLSIGLVGVLPTSAKLAVLLRSQDTLLVLPYLGLMFAAFNALAITLNALASTTVRAMRRSRNLDPAEQSMFSVRLLIVLFGVMLVFFPRDLAPPPTQLFVWALCLGSAAIFMPLAASIWMTNVPRTALVFAVPVGAAAAVVGLLVPATGFEFTAIEAGAVGLASSTIIILLGRAFTFVRRQRIIDPQLEILRYPENSA